MLDALALEHSRARREAVEAEEGSFHEWVCGSFHEEGGQFARIMMNLSEVLNIPPYINVLSELAERSLTVTDLYQATSGAHRTEVSAKNLDRSSKSVA